MNLIILQVALLYMVCQAPVMAQSLLPNNPNSLQDLDGREAKFLSTFITIRNVACNSTTKEQCLTESDCAGLGGKATGLCLLGLGVCCDVDGTETSTSDIECDGTASGKITRFLSPESPTTPTTCKLSVTLVNDNICQLKIDFNKFNIAPPDGTNGKCDQEYFSVTGSSNDKKIPILCGDNSDNHVYVDVNPVSSPVISMILGKDISDRSWNFTVTQIECDDENRAPAGCLQYYTGQSGTIKGFNFKSSLSDIEEANTHIGYPGYGACIASKGYCKVTYTSKDRYSFLMSGDTGQGGNFNDVDESFLEQSITFGDMCQADYVVIPQGEYTIGSKTYSSDRFCGFYFPSEVTSDASPFVLHVKLDDMEMANGDTKNNGFALDYLLNEQC